MQTFDKLHDQIRSLSIYQGHQQIIACTRALVQLREYSKQLQARADVQGDQLDVARFFWYHEKSDLSYTVAYTGQATFYKERKTRPCLTSHSVEKGQAGWLPPPPFDSKRSKNGTFYKHL